MTLLWIAIGLVIIILIGVPIRDAIFRRTGFLPAAGKATMADVERLTRAGQLLIAIRCYREIHKCGLVEARQAIEYLKRADQASETGQPLKHPRVKTSEGDVIGVQPSDADMQLASQEARNAFARFVEEFHKQDPACPLFIAKAFYPDPKLPGGGEHLWLTVQSVTDSSVTGIITSHPIFITTVKAQDRVEVKLPQISDWLFVRNGKAIGGFTVQLLRSRMTVEQKAQHDSAYPFSFE